MVKIMRMVRIMRMITNHQLYWLAYWAFLFTGMFTFLFAPMPWAIGGVGFVLAAVGVAILAIQRKPWEAKVIYR